MVDKNFGGNFLKGRFEKLKVPRKRPLVVQRPRRTPKTVNSSGVNPKDWSLDSIWLMYTKELEIKTFEHADYEILELSPPDSPTEGSSECYKTYINYCDC